MKFRKYAFLLAIAAITGINPAASAQSKPEQIPVVKSPGEQAFMACRACHTLQKGGKNGLGPNLHGMFAQPAASAPGFNYTDALKASKLRWDDRTLGEFLASPTKKVPGSRMPVTVPDPAKRAALIAHLKAETSK